MAGREITRAGAGVPCEVFGTSAACHDGEDVRRNARSAIRDPKTITHPQDYAAELKAKATVPKA